MKLLAEIHGYPPYHNSGAEWMAHHMFRHAVQHGHEVTILLNFNSYLGKVSGPYEFEGVKVVSDENWRSYYKEADAIFTHLDKTPKAYNQAREYGKPLFHIVHNDYNNVVREKMYGVDQYAIYNTYWVEKECRKREKGIKKSIVVRPPVYTEDYVTKRINNYITLINLNINKGGKFLIELAKRLPKEKFMAVMGSYGEQQIDYKIKNINYVENTGQIKNVYKRTRILIMPSTYESYGRTAIEAASSGIPVICNNTPGLHEAMGEAGIYHDLDLDQWVMEIKKLKDDKNYEIASNKSRQRAEEVNPTKELNLFLNFVEHECKNCKNTR